MERVRVIEHRGKRILFTDVAGCGPAEVVEALGHASRWITEQPQASVRTLTDAREARFDTRVTDALRQYTDINRPHVKAAALVGISGLKKIVVQSLQRLNSRNFELFEDLEEAKDYLAGF